MITIRLDSKEAQRRLKAFAGLAEKAIQAAINKTLTSGKTMAKRAISDHYNIKQGRVAEAISTQKAFPGNAGRIIAKGKDIGLVNFGPRPKASIGRNNRKPLSVEITRGKRVTVKGGFSAAARLPIKRLTTRGVAGMMDSHRVMDKLEPEIQADAQKQLASQINRLLAGK